MPAVGDMHAWIRLGRLLEQRRVMMDSRYSNLALFAEERGINYRMAWDIEQGRRTNYRRATRLAIDVAYGWRPGSVDAVLEGRNPDPLDEDDRRPELVPECEFERRIAASDADEDQKLLIIRGHRAEGHSTWCRPDNAQPSALASAAGLPG